MATIYFMRFRLSQEEESLFLVGADLDKMRKDAPLFDKLAEGCEEGEIVNSEVVIEAADRRCFPKSSLKNAVAAARAGSPSLYLFG